MGMEIVEAVNDIVKRVGFDVRQEIISLNNPKYKNILNRGVSLGFNRIDLDSGIVSLNKKDVGYILLPNDFRLEGDCKSLFAGSFFERLGGIGTVRCIDLTCVNVGEIYDLSQMFNCCYNVERIILPEKLDVSHTKNMDGMFNNCRGLRYLRLPNDLDTNNIRTMSYLFYGCNNINEIILPDNFSTSNVVEMNHAFYDCSSLERLVIPVKFRLKHIEQCVKLFEKCNRLVKLEFMGGNRDEDFIAVFNNTLDGNKEDISVI